MEFLLSGLIGVAGTVIGILVQRRLAAGDDLAREARVRTRERLERLSRALLDVERARPVAMG